MWIILAGAWLSAVHGTPSAAPCTVQAVGIDTSQADFVTGPSPPLGQAMGQVFFAPDTLIQSITVWRWAGEDTNYAGWQLYIAETDSLGRPNVDAILTDSLIVWNYYGDGVHHIPMRFVFDPPFSLPRHAKYEFAIQAVPCDGYFNLVADDNNAYPEGEFWRHGATVYSGCRLRINPDPFPLLDLVFEIEFCDPVVPTELQTWGHVKALYR